jgi:hypothetical protein
MAAPKEFITLDQLQREHHSLYERWGTRVERFRKAQWYRCSPGSVDKVGFPKADALRVTEFMALVRHETGKEFLVPKLPPYRDGNIVF